MDEEDEDEERNSVTRCVWEREMEEGKEEKDREAEKERGEREREKERRKREKRE